MAEITLTFRVTWPWWLKVAKQAALAWAWLRLPMDVDATVAWFTAHLRLDVVEG